jgi:hypothetical protein
VLRAKAIVHGAWIGWEERVILFIVQFDGASWRVLFICTDVDYVRNQVSIDHVTQLAWELVAHPIYKLSTDCGIVFVDGEFDFGTDIAVDVQISLDLSKQVVWKTHDSGGFLDELLHVIVVIDQFLNLHDRILFLLFCKQSVEN